MAGEGTTMSAPFVVWPLTTEIAVADVGGLLLPPLPDDALVVFDAPPEPLPHPASPVSRAINSSHRSTRIVSCTLRNPASAVELHLRVQSRTSMPSRKQFLSQAAAESLRGYLLAWYDGGHRDLPWRRTRDPYGIWVSEIMLQQTRVATVIPYWERWMTRFPTVRALADAPLDDVLAAWAGLGYYSRARNLHAGAQAVATKWAGALPSRAAELREVPGIGPYTAGAIASI